MYKMDQVQKAPVRVFGAVFASFGLALVLCCLFAFLGCEFGLLFSGLDSFLAVLAGTAFCGIATALTTLLCKRNGTHFAGGALFTEVLLLALFAVGLLSWLQTRQHVRVVMKPEPVPRGVRIHHGRSAMFGLVTHFTGPPESIAAIIQAKELVEVPNQFPDQGDVDGWNERQRTTLAHDWWQPARMATARFFYRHHKSDAIQGWCEGWWVNAATNEVYAVIGS